MKILRNKGDGVKYCNTSATLEQCPCYDNNKPRHYYFELINDGSFTIVLDSEDL